ncbi:MAG: EAL domain-containing protein [Lysobacter sp.]|nr:EAL domain-containing protein [Lysobacter sp.]
MTLFKQLTIGVSILFFVLLAGVEAIYLANARAQLQEQLGSQAQDAATSLSLRMATLGRLDDKAMIETIVNPVFDRGYFQELRVVSVDGQVLVRKALPAKEAGVPEWFAALFPIHAPSAQSLVSSGWSQLGRVVVTSQPYFAYQQLWQTGMQTLAWLVFGYLAAIGAGAAFLAMMLRPLREIERVAVQIGQRNFTTVAIVPKTRELASVVGAMNDMSGRISKAMDEDAALAEKLRREAYVDPLTALYNRRGFERQLQALIQSTGDVQASALALVEIRDFGDFNAKAGYRRGDEVIALVAAALVDACGGRSTLCARMGGAGFAFVAVNVDQAGLEDMVLRVCSRLERLLADQGLGAELHFHCGVTHRQGALRELSELLASADHAVEVARGKGENEFAIEAFDKSASEGSQAWRALIQECIDSGAIALYTQEVFGLPERKGVHREVTVRLVQGDGEPIAAAQFLPMAVRHGMVGRLDCLMVDKLLGHLEKNPGQEAYAVNVAARTIAAPEDMRRLLALLDARKALAARLTFEMTEFGALEDLELTRRFGEELRKRGARFALDNFSMRQDSLMLVHALRPQYIKLSMGYSREIEDNQDCRFLVTSIVRSTAPLGIGIFAQAVESEGLIPLLGELGLAGYQGYAAARPTRLL